MQPDMAPYITMAWAVSGASLGALTLWSLWRYTRRDQ